MPYLGILAPGNSGTSLPGGSLIPVHRAHSLFLLSSPSSPLVHSALLHASPLLLSLYSWVRLSTSPIAPCTRPSSILRTHGRGGVQAQQVLRSLLHHPRLVEGARQMVLPTDCAHTGELHDYNVLLPAHAHACAAAALTAHPSSTQRVLCSSAPPQAPPATLASTHQSNDYSPPSTSPARPSPLQGRPQGSSRNNDASHEEDAAVAIFQPPTPNSPTPRARPSSICWGTRRVLCSSHHDSFRRGGDSMQLR